MRGGSYEQERGRFDRPRWQRHETGFDPGAGRQHEGSGGAQPLGEGEELVAGRRPVEEAFAARREAIRLLVVPERRPALEALVLHAATLRIPVVEVEGGTLTSVAGFDGHQGVALVVAPRRWATIDEVLARARERDEPPFVLVLDSLEDPQNLGTLMRSAEAAGVHGVLFPTRRSAPLTPAAIKASAGAVEHLLLTPVDDLAGALVDLGSYGLRRVGADEEAPLIHRDADLRGPLALIVGSEGHGLGPTVRRRLDLAVRIPMRGRVGSLNAAVAGSVLLFEVAAQRAAGGDEPRATGSELATETPAPEPVAEVEAAPEPDAEPKRERTRRTKSSTDASPGASTAEAAAGPPVKPKRTRRTKSSTDASPATAPPPVDELLPGEPP